MDMAKLKIPHESLIGKTYGRLTVISFSKASGGDINYKCQCECGNYTTVRKHSLTTGATRSCGCFYPKHGKTDTKSYSAWAQIKHRCNNKKHQYNHNGITYSDGWEDFENFYKDIGDPPDDSYRLSRIDKKGNFTKENCRWIPKSKTN